MRLMVKNYVAEMNPCYHYFNVIWRYYLHLHLTENVNEK